MEKILGRIDKVAKAIGVVAVALGFARSRVKHFNDIAHKADAAAELASRRGDELRAQGRPAKATRQDRKASRKRRRAHNARERRQVWIGRVKSLAQRKHDLKARKEELDRQLEKLKPRVEGKRIVGGSSAWQRLQFGILLSISRCERAQRRNFYSQPGRFTADKLIEGEGSGDRSDCSQWLLSLYWACKLPAPDGWGYRGGYTGSLEQGMDPCSVTFARNHAGCAVIYGSPGRTFHVEATVGDGSDRTGGHGDARINFGVIDLFGDGNYRCFKPKQLS
jgi:hypothetical protein